MRHGAASILSERSHPARLTALAFLAGLILAAGTADVIVPAITDPPGSASELAEPIASPVGDYCRIRGNGPAVVRQTLVAATPRLPGASLTPRARFRVSPTGPLLSPGGEHSAPLARRSRAPGLRAG